MVLLATVPLLAISDCAMAELSQGPHFMPTSSHQSIHTPTAQTPDYINLPDQITPTGENTFIFSPKMRRWVAYDENGLRVAGGVGNGGADFCEEINEPCRTPIGKFRITRKGDETCASSQFPVGVGGSPMPYCMFFKRGNAIHGSPYISNQNTSHGCIRVLTPAAKWLSKYFLKYRTQVIVLPYE